MRKGFFVAPAVVLFALLGSTTARADEYSIDPTHTGVNFRIAHLGLSWTFGRFNDVSGTFNLDGANAVFNLTIKTDSVDTGNKQRDGHLNSPDFFNTRQFPQITF